MEEASAAIVAGVEQLAAQWVVSAVTSILDAWGRLDPSERAAALDQARAAGAMGAVRTVAELRDFFATDPAWQRTTPLAIVRTLRREATSVLAAAGVPPVERDPFDTGSFPDDVYALVPQSLADLGDDDLAPMLMVWGIGKSKVLALEQPVPRRRSRDNGARDGDCTWDMSAPDPDQPVTDAADAADADGARAGRRRRGRSCGSARSSPTPPTSSPSSTGPVSSST